MSEPKDLIEQLRRSNRRWKALALAACSVLVLAALAGFVAMARDQMRTQALVRAMQQEGANAIKAARDQMRTQELLRTMEQDGANALKAANAGQPR